MTANPLADAVSRFLDVGPPPCFKVLAVDYCEPGKMYIMDPAGMELDDPQHPGMKLIVCPTEEDAEQVRVWARDLGLELVDDA